MSQFNDHFNQFEFNLSNKVIKMSWNVKVEVQIDFGYLLNLKSRLDDLSDDCSSGYEKELFKEYTCTFNHN